MEISKYFKRSDFACKCGCGQDTVDAELIQILDKLREHFDKPIVVTSGNRCAAYNKKIGGEDNSFHMKGRAADIKVLGIEPAIVQNHFNSLFPNSYGMGSYNTFTHVDSRGYKARWNG